MDGTASVGSSGSVARSDHRHPTDTSRAAASDLNAHTGNTTVHITADERGKWNGKQDKLTVSGGSEITTSMSGAALTLGLADSGVTARTYGPFLNGICWMANNGGRASTTATWTLTAKKAGTFRFLYAGSGEENYDYLTVTVKGIEVLNKKGIVSPHGGYFETTLAVGDVVVFKHIEDSSNFYDGDYAGIGNLILGKTDSTFDTITPENISTYFTVENGTYTFVPMVVFTGGMTQVDAKGRVINAKNIYPVIYPFDKWNQTVGAADVGDLTKYAPIASPAFTNSVSLNRKAGTTVGPNSVAEGLDVTASGVASHAEGHDSTASGVAAHAEGVDTKAGDWAHAEGNGTTASGQGAHAEGRDTTASGSNSHAEEQNTTASGSNSHAEGYYTYCDGIYSAHVEGNGSVASDLKNVIPIASYLGSTLTAQIGVVSYLDSAFDKITAGMEVLVFNNYYANVNCPSYTVASVDITAHTITLTAALPTSNFQVKYIVIPGIRVTNSYYAAHAEGVKCLAIGTASHAEGSGTTASGGHSHAEGNRTTASGLSAHAKGSSTTALGDTSHAEGLRTTASGHYSHAEGLEIIASNYASHVGGKYNKAMTTGGTNDNTTGDAFVIGNGTGSSALSNCFRVTYSGAVYGKSAFNSIGADYAEFFEWQDGNPDHQDRVDYFVTLDGNQIRVANPGDYILGIVSGQPCIIGNADEDWLGRWQHDEFGRFVKEDVDTPVTEWREVETTSDNTTAFDGTNDDVQPATRTEMVEVPTGEVIHGWRYKANPDYDLSQPYVERKDRPEWSAVGMLGVLSVRDDGTCQVNGFCQVADGGIATAATAEFSIVDGQIRKGYRVMKRVSDSVVKVVFR